MPDRTITILTDEKTDDALVHDSAAPGQVAPPPLKVDLDAVKVVQNDAYVQIPHDPAFPRFLRGTKIRNLGNGEVSLATAIGNVHKLDVGKMIAVLLKATEIPPVQ